LTSVSACCAARPTISGAVSPAPLLAIDPLLSDTHWRLASVSGTAVPSDAQITLDFTDGGIHGLFACASYAIWATTFGRQNIDITCVDGVTTECAIPSLTGAQYRDLADHYTQQLLVVTSYELRDNRLLLAYADNPLLEFQRSANRTQ
jgi:hypothetical protein